MASALQLKEWAADRMKQATESVSRTAANSYRSLAQTLQALSARRVSRDTRGPPRRNDPSPSPDE